MKGHSCWRIALILFTFLVFVCSTALSGIRDNYAVQWGWFRNTTGDIQQLLVLDIDPAPWTLYIWYAVFAYNFIWLCYSLSTICRSAYRDSYLYYNPPYLPMGIYVNIILSFGGQVAALFCMDLQYIWIACIVNFLITISCLIALGVAFVGLGNHTDELKSRGKKAEIGWTIALVHNGIGLYATWLAIVSLMNLGVVLVYTVGWSQDLACTVVMGIWSGVIFIWFYLDMCLIWRRTMYLLTPYMGIAFVLAGIIVELWDPWSKLFIFAVSMLGATALFFIIKLIYTCVRARCDGSGDSDSFQYYGRENGKQPYEY